MLYAIVKPLMKAALHLYFGRIVRNGLEHIDNGRPTLILANHTASFMDAMITACFIRRRIHFFARGDVFTNKWVNKILRSFGLMPVYRLIDGRHMLQHNDSSNEEALKILERGGAVLIFAEGASHVAKVLKPLKKGPFRLAATAAVTLPEAPLLVPMGINYVTPARPFGDVFLNASEPIKTTDFQSVKEPASTKAATDMMRATATALEPLAWHIPNETYLPAADDLLHSLKNADPDYSFAVSQQLLGMLNGVNGQGRQKSFAELLESGNPGGSDLSGRIHYFKKPDLMEWLGIIIGAPVVLAGYVAYFIPVRFAKFLADKKVKEADFWAPVFICCALIGVLLWATLWIIAGIVWQQLPAVLACLAIAAASGIFWLKWYRPLWDRLNYKPKS